MLDVPLKEGTSYYGEVFEHFLISEVFKLCSYVKPDWTLSYFTTKDDAEIDLIIDRPSQKPILIGIKSTSKIDAADLSATLALMNDFGEAEAYILSQDSLTRKIGVAKAVHWRVGLAEIFG